MRVEEVLALPAGTRVRFESRTDCNTAVIREGGMHASLGLIPTLRDDRTEGPTLWLHPSRVIEVVADAAEVESAALEAVARSRYLMVGGGPTSWERLPASERAGWVAEAGWWAARLDVERADARRRLTNQRHAG